MSSVKISKPSTTHRSQPTGPSKADLSPNWRRVDEQNMPQQNSASQNLVPRVDKGKAADSCQASEIVKVSFLKMAFYKSEKDLISQINDLIKSEANLLYSIKQKTRSVRRVVVRGKESPVDGARLVHEPEALKNLDLSDKEDQVKQDLVKLDRQKLKDVQKRLKAAKIEFNERFAPIYRVKDF